VTKTTRLDTELVRRGLLSSRVAAKRAVEEGRVNVGGMPVTKPASLVTDKDPITLAGPPSRFVSRGGEKLDGALGRLDVSVEGRRWLDAGASTGGFTDRLLQGGAAAVIALDVGYGQLDGKLRNDERVVVMERSNVRTVRPQDLPWPPDGVVADLAFISLVLVLPALVSVARPDADFLLLVKPQFEAGKESVGQGGVVRDRPTWEAAIRKVVGAAHDLSLGLVGVALADPPGPSGNREFFVHLRAGAEPDEGAIDEALDEVEA
jgi:23S rRNA (cytidine1920-2'-O)/16S rRNA (cytidine1409-2'-O)-methyltransferase